MNHLKIDFVDSKSPFVCGTCGRLRTGLKNRIINAIPDFPSPTPVDLLICGSCWAAGKADPEDDSEEQHRDFVRRYPEALS